MSLDSAALPPLTLTGAPHLDLAPWHAARPHVLANALQEARAVAPHLDELAARWLPRLPRRPLASQNIRAICRDPSSGPLLLYDAITCPWIGLNTDTAVNAILLDVDHEDALEHRAELIALACPVPDIMLDPWSGRAHVVQWLATPVLTTDAARLGPQTMESYAGRLLAAAFRATLLPQAGLVKSPWGRVSALTGIRMRRGPRPSVAARWEAYEAAQVDGSDLMWITIPGTGPAELRDIISSLAPRYEFDVAPSKPKVTFRKNRGVPDGRGRNCELFDLVRWWAYDHAELSTEAIRAEADSINNSGIFVSPLPPSEVSALARSIGRYMRSRYRPRHAAGAHPSRGRDQAEGADLDATDRKRLAGVRSAAARAAATDARIANAVAVLQTAGAPLTQAAIAKAAAIGINTVSRRWKVLANPPFAALSGSAGPSHALGPKAPLPKKQKSSSSLADLARCDRVVRTLVAALLDVTAAMQRPGSRPTRLPVVSSELREHPRVRAAQAKAEAALRDASRRADARVAREAAQDRAAQMLLAVHAMDGGRAWWKSHLAELSDYWNAAENEHLDNPCRLAVIKARRAAVFLSRACQWKRARRLAGPVRPAVELV